MQTYLTRHGETLDAIAWRVYGTEQAVHAILKANPHVTYQPAELPPGLKLTLPDAPVSARPVQTVRLWA
ncbi:tail protein X [Castellaniella denitrificans]|jgi:phage tail protein X|uniref:tail protein X n=1 Tax=Castellaniella denitrificans TaxID=56119 RepID=UPI003609120E